MSANQQVTVNVAMRRSIVTRLAVYKCKTISKGSGLVQHWPWTRRTARAARHREHFRCFKQTHGFNTTVWSARNRFRHHNLCSEETD